MGATTFRIRNKSPFSLQIIRIVFVLNKHRFSNLYRHKIPYPVILRKGQQFEIDAMLLQHFAYRIKASKIPNPFRKVNHIGIIVSQQHPVRIKFLQNYPKHLDQPLLKSAKKWY